MVGILVNALGSYRIRSFKAHDLDLDDRVASIFSEIGERFCGWIELERCNIPSEDIVLSVLKQCNRITSFHLRDSIWTYDDCVSDSLLECLAGQGAFFFAVTGEKQATTITNEGIINFLFTKDHGEIFRILNLQCATRANAVICELLVKVSMLAQTIHCYGYTKGLPRFRVRGVSTGFGSGHARRMRHAKI